MGNNNLCDIWLILNTVNDLGQKEVMHLEFLEIIKFLIVVEAIGFLHLY